MSPTAPEEKTTEPTDLAPAVSPVNKTEADEAEVKETGTEEKNPDVKTEDDKATTSEEQKREGGGGEEETEATFPQQLMDIIDAESKEGCGIMTSKGQRVIEWLPEGKSFTIRDKAKLEKEVLPKYFHAKCKFMSFVRKLYRWGFRQVDKTLPTVMVFTHTNFVRGQRKRCLMMRSIVKKQNAQGRHQQGGAGGGSHNMPPQGMMMPQGMNQPYGGMSAAMMSAMAGGGGSDFPSSSMFQAFGANHGQFNGQFGGMGGMMSGMGGGMGGHMGGGNFPRQVTYPGGSNFDSQGGGEGLMNSSRFGGMSNQGPSGVMGMGGMTSRDVFEAGLRLERMEREQQQMQQAMGMMNNTGGNNGNGSGPPSNNGNSFKGFPGDSNSSFSPPMNMGNGGNNNGGNFGGPGNSNLGGNEMSQIELASQLMKRDPSMEPWRALEMAKQFNNNNSSNVNAGGNETKC